MVKKNKSNNDKLRLKLFLAVRKVASLLDKRELAWFELNADVEYHLTKERDKDFQQKYIEEFVCYLWDPHFKP